MPTRELAVLHQQDWTSSIRQLAIHALQQHLQSAARHIHASIRLFPVQLRQSTSGCDASCMDHPLPYFSIPAVGRSHGRARQLQGTQLT